MCLTVIGSYTSGTHAGTVAVGPGVITVLRMGRCTMPVSPGSTGAVHVATSTSPSKDLLKVLVDMVSVKKLLKLEEKMASSNADNDE